MKLVEGMVWPPESIDRHKQKEHGVWYSGEPDVLANFYANASENMLKLQYGMHNKNTFWGRQHRNRSSFYLHVPVAGDISETSAAFLFGESPIIRFDGVKDKLDKDQEQLDEMLTESKFYRKILEGAECGSAIGGVFIKLAWDTEISKYPIPVVVQSDDAYPTFKFGVLTEVLFPTTYEIADNKVYRLFEKYDKSGITYELYLGSVDRLGVKTSIKDFEETKDLADQTTGYMCAFYVPNLLPNRLNRKSNCGRSDYAGVESLMDSLDEAFTCWMIDVQNARARLHLPTSWLEGADRDDGEGTFNIDKRMYVQLNLDPLTKEAMITPTQFAIRSEDFEKTCLNLMDRIITSAGYSPQSFGLNIQGRAESGTALNVRERKSHMTTGKKESYWEPEIKNIVTAMCKLYIDKMGGKFTRDIVVNVAFSDFTASNQSEVANCVKLLSDAAAISTDTKVRMVHPEWTDKEVGEEVAKIMESSSMVPAMDPEGNPDTTQIDAAKQSLIDEEE